MNKMVNLTKLQKKYEQYKQNIIIEIIEIYCKHEYGKPNTRK